MEAQETQLISFLFSTQLQRNARWILIISWITPFGALYNEKKNRGNEFKTTFMRVTLPSKETFLHFHADNLLWSFIKIRSQIEHLQGLTPIGIPNREKGKWVIPHKRKPDAAYTKFGLTLKPKILLLWKLTRKHNTNLNPLSTTLMVHIFLPTNIARDDCIVNIL